MLRPSVVVKTGLGSGLSSTFILQALNDNHKGNLYSIALPKATYTTEKSEEIDEATLIPEKSMQSGWLIPESLRDRWELLLGKSKDRLPSLLKKLKNGNNRHWNRKSVKFMFTVTIFTASVFRAKMQLVFPFLSLFYEC